MGEKNNIQILIAMITWHVYLEYCKESDSIDFLIDARYAKRKMLVMSMVKILNVSL